MTLQDYTTEELRAELKRRNDLVKAEKTKVKKMQNVQTLGCNNLFWQTCKLHYWK